MTVLAVATYNVHQCVGGDGRYDPARTLAVARDLDADLLALQELRWNPADALHLLHEFGEALGCRTLAGPTLLRPDGHYGNAILTRLEVTHVARIDLSVVGREPRGALDAEVTKAGMRVRVIATHLGLRPGERRQQVHRLLAQIDRGAHRPTILLGDLNEWFLWGRPLRWLHRQFGRSPSPATFPASRPVFALDRIWVRPRESLVGLDAHDTPLAREASDHLPVRAELRLPGQPEEGGAAIARRPVRRAR